MAEPTDRSARIRWLVAGGGALAGVMLALFLFRLPRSALVGPPGSRPAAGAATVMGETRNSLVAQAAELTDPRPLFLPTRWNGSQKELTTPEMGEFPGYPAKLVFSADRLSLDLPPAVEVPRTPADALTGATPGYPVAGLGRTDVRVPALPVRAAIVKVMEAGSGKVVWSREVAPGVLTVLGDRPWQTQEFLATVAPGGFVVAPAPIPPRLDAGTVFPSLEGEAVAAVQNYLVDGLFLGQVLDPGFYRISVGP